MAKIKALEQNVMKKNETVAEYQKELETQGKKYEQQILDLQKQRIKLTDDLEQVCMIEMT